MKYITEIKNDNNLLNFQTQAFDTKAIKELDNGDIEITWYASTKSIDSYNDIVEPSAFAKNFKRYFDNPVILLQHDQNKVIGKAIKVWTDSKWLKIKAVINNNIDNIKENILKWNIKWFSIWYAVRKVEFERKDVNWIPTVIRRIKELELREISVVSVPANPSSLFGIKRAVKKYLDDNNNILMEEVKNNTDIEIKDISDDELMEALKIVKEQKMKEIEKEIENQKDEKINEENEVETETLDEIENDIENQEDEKVLILDSKNWKYKSISKKALDKFLSETKEDEKTEVKTVEEDNNVVIDKTLFKALVLEIKEAKNEIKSLQSNINKIWFKKWHAYLKTEKKSVSINKLNEEFLNNTLV